jgi:hypothetical protein
MKNTPDYSFRAFLHELMTKRDVQVFAAKSLIFLFGMGFGLAFIISLYNAIKHP